MYTTSPCGYKTPKFEMKKASCNGSEYKPLKKSPFKKKALRLISVSEFYGMISAIRQ